MSVRRYLVGIGAAALAFGIGEQAAQAAIAGHPGYSAKLSSNATVKQQQLLCDPANVTFGSTTTSYDPTIVSLDNVTSSDGFGITGVYLDVTTPSDPEDVQMVTAYAGPAIPEVDVASSGILSTLNQTGLMQVTWGLLPDEGDVTPAIVVPPPGDDDTDTITFDWINPDETIYAPYTNYGADETNDVFEPDFLQGIDAEGNPFYYSADPNSPNYYPGGFTPASVSGPLVPEPASVGLLSVVGLGLLGRRRRS